METYIKWSFWLGIVGLGLVMPRMIVSTYPRKEETSLRADVVRLVISGFFAVWAWSLIYR